MDPNVQRWMSARRSELVVAILKKEKTLIDVCRENDLKQSEVNKWIEQFFECSRRNLKINSEDKMIAHRKEVESLQAELSSEGEEVSISKLCSILGMAGRPCTPARGSKETDCV